MLVSSMAVLATVEPKVRMPVWLVMVRGALTVSGEARRSQTSTLSPPRFPALSPTGSVPSRNACGRVHVTRRLLPS